ncbi:MAG: hypothetical protein E5X19_02080, partial [Mesorhizobium sp.]
MRSIEERGKAPISVFGAIEHSVVDDTPAEPAVGVEGPGQSSCSVVEQTRGEPSSACSQPSSSVLHLQPELLGEIAERLSPIDLLMMSQTNQQLRVGAMVVAAPQESRQRAIRVQAIWNKLTEPLPGVYPSALLFYPSVIQSLAPNLNCLTIVQQERLVALFEGL